MSSSQPALCIDCGKRKKKLPAYRCSWCWLAKQSIDDQVMYAERRRARAEAKGGYEYRARMPEREWHPGWRWCSGCQQQVPVEYTRGARCRAHASQASRASQVERTYDISREEYAALLEWQGGRCYICGEKPRARRLAVDHDHRTNAVRGLLCSSEDWGCNKTLAKLLNKLSVAQRALAYVEKSPLERMRSGEQPMTYVMG